MLVGIIRKMKIQITLFKLIEFIWSISAQVRNDKGMIIKNKDNDSFDKHCFSGSNSSCTDIWEKYGRKGIQSNEKWEDWELSK